MLLLSTRSDSFSTPSVLQRVYRVLLTTFLTACRVPIFDREVLLVEAFSRAIGPATSRDCLHSYQGSG